MYDRQARADFSRARRKAFWQQVRSWISGRPDSLLPFDEVREAIPIRGQRYRGLQTIPIRKIVGSMGRYHEFNRAFLPKQAHTARRWVNIGKAHYENITLPPIEVYRLGDVYFVKDGNHRVSVGKELGMEFIDAFVTEIDIPVQLTEDTDVSDLAAKRESSRFLEKTGLLHMFPDASIELSLPGDVERLFQQIDTHRYYLAIQSSTEPQYDEAVRSWYLNVYTPLVAEIERQGLPGHFPTLTMGDLYLMVSEYQWNLLKVYKDETSLEEADRQFTKALEKIAPEAHQSARRMARTLHLAPWLDDLILSQERREFEERTNLPLMATVPGAYTTLLQHIHDHRWFMGIDQNRSIPWEEAVQSWHQNIYRPLAVLIEDLDILKSFPDRTETDLYLWIIAHQKDLSASLDWEIPTEIAAQNLVRNAGAAEEGTPPSLRRPDMPLLFRDLLVPLGDRQEDLVALDQALVIAERNHGRIHGLHVISSQDELDDAEHAAIVADFEERCRRSGIPGRIALDHGSIAATISERARWTDLIVLHLNYPPASSGLSKMASGIRHVLRRSGRPVLAVPGAPSPLQKILLAYDGSPLADEALFTAARFLSFWEDTRLAVLTAQTRKKQAGPLLDRARAFLDAHHVDAEYIESVEPAAEAILAGAAEFESDLILMGGYGNAPLMDIAFGSALDEVLQKSSIPVLIRT